MTRTTQTLPTHSAIDAIVRRARADQARAIGHAIRTVFGKVTAPFRRPTDPVSRAIAELQACSDRELADLGIGRGDIRDAVLYGRPGIDDVAVPANDTGRTAMPARPRRAA